jgi:four helix bundle protein
MEIAETCYNLSRELPGDERYGLASQMKRAAVSMPANFAEGHGRELPGSFVKHLRIAQGSLKELETLLLLAQRNELADQHTVAAPLAKCDELGGMKRSMVRSIPERQ